MRFRERLPKPSAAPFTEALFQRLLGLVYLAAFASLLPQIVGLMGDHGITPAWESLAALREELGPKAYFYVPTLFWFGASDAALRAVCLIGCAASLFLLCGLFRKYVALICFLLYLSLTTAGQPFTGFQWDALLLECGFLALFEGASWVTWAYRFLLFRLMFESGVAKLSSHDPNWRNLHALRYHFLTQPLPTPLAYYMYRAPTWLLDSLTATTLVIEILVPFLLFFPKQWRRSAGVFLISLQICILLTGNYAFFNLLTLCLCLWCFDDSTFAPLQRFLLRTYPARAKLSSRLERPANLVLAVLLIVGALQVCSSVLPAFATVERKLTLPIDPFEIVNHYGLFAVMTTNRPEIILEGSNDQEHWTEYSFRYKPGDLHRNLPVVAPYQPRLDWQMWFAALGSYRQNPWVAGLVYRLLLNEPSVTSLLEPFRFTGAPKYIRAELYDYTFSTPAERRETGEIWKRELLGKWLGPVSLPASTVGK